MALRIWLVLSLLLAAATLTFPTSPVHAEQLAAPRVELVSVRTLGGYHLFKTEIADTPRLRERGLMFRHRLPADRAMLFDFGEVRPVSMWMRNTRIPLDMLFIARNGRIVSIARDTTPGSTKLIVSGEPVLAVLEVLAGTVDRLGIKPGDMVLASIFQQEKAGESE